MDLRGDFERNVIRPETILSPVGVIHGMDDQDLLDVLQKQTLRYFWDYAHPLCGMARERKVSNDYNFYDPLETVTTGGTGFGIMGMIAGVDRGWLNRGEVRNRLSQIVGFLEKVETHCGVFPHFINGRTGQANFCRTMGEGEDMLIIPLAENGGNIVETAFLFMGLLTARQYFSQNITFETLLRDRIDTLWRKIEWDAHLSPDGKDLQWLNHPETGLGDWPVTGWNEALVAHIMAAASPTHAVPETVYKTGWTSGRDFYKNGENLHQRDLHLGPPGGGPLFFSHYSFLGLDPRGLKDSNADYWQQNISHTLINRAYCVENNRGHKGYGPNCWGLTASDNPNGYEIHKPDCNHPDIGSTDDGTIAPTAALSSFPYTPVHSMEVLRHFYEDRGHEIWTDYGFADAFNPSKEWIASSHLAIDQGPIIVMIENYRSGLLWNLFMSCPEIQHALDKLGFESPHIHKPKFDIKNSMEPV